MPRRRPAPVTTPRLVLLLGAAAVTAVVIGARGGPAQGSAELALRGRPQHLRLLGEPGSPAVVLTSGDGGWIHLAPHVAGVLAAHGYFVVGVDARAYLESFTSARETLQPSDEPGDFRALAEFAGRGSRVAPVLVGVSEGAGLSVLAATDPATKRDIRGVVGLGLPDINELGFRWRDYLIYITHGIPHEPTFSARAVIDRVAPLPLAVIHSTHDEFVPLSDARAMVAAARPPKRLWVIDAADHRFSDRLDEFDGRLLDALAWVAAGGR